MAVEMSKPGSHLLLREDSIQPREALRCLIHESGPLFRPPLSQLRQPKDSLTGDDKMTSGKTLEDATHDFVPQTLEETKWVVGGRQGAAARLGRARTTLIGKMRRPGIEPAGDEAGGQSGSREEACGAMV